MIRHSAFRPSLLVLMILLAAAPLDTESLSLLEDIEIRPGVQVDLTVTVHGDLDAEHCQFAVHGGTFTAATWRPYAEALGLVRQDELCVLALDMPRSPGALSRRSTACRPANTTTMTTMSDDLGE